MSDAEDSVDKFINYLDTQTKFVNFVFNMANGFPSKSSYFEDTETDSERDCDCESNCESDCESDCESNCESGSDSSDEKPSGRNTMLLKITSSEKFLNSGPAEKIGNDVLSTGAPQLTPDVNFSTKKYGEGLHLYHVRRYETKRILCVCEEHKPLMQIREILQDEDFDEQTCSSPKIKKQDTKPVESDYQNGYYSDP
ncbi:uncharacterized protein LOC119662165 [Teleopsis dalmanni]|uniref:uncharacterized protein LOC119662165 n=1 Tax=Teleopsis dalmanni TaxID=139649 RepID=UPI0018CF4954|nr:uncharacterized protein LOC119662165 [Teleopsis dalmanni]